MKASDRTILIVLAGLALVAAFWFLVLSPKRSELSELDDEIATKQAEVAQQEELAAMAGTAKEDYEQAYQELVVLGKAVPAESDQASMVEQINTLAAKANIDFQGLALAGSGEGTDAAATAPAPTEGPTGGEASTTTEGPAESGGGAETTTAAAPAPATEAVAATLPIGATVGSAGLPVLPYDLTFTGDFFDMADFFAGIDDLVKSKRNGKKLGVSGRLMTIDGFTFGPSDQGNFPLLDANLHVTSYVAPPDQGVTGGATPTEPAPAATVSSTTAAPPTAVATP